MKLRHICNPNNTNQIKRMKLRCLCNPSNTNQIKRMKQKHLCSLSSLSKIHKRMKFRNPSNVRNVNKRMKVRHPSNLSNFNKRMKVNQKNLSVIISRHRNGQRFCLINLRNQTNSSTLLTQSILKGFRLN